MANKNRDEFTEKTKLQIAKRAGLHCSDPSCRRLTTGSNSTGDGEINLGMAAHICAASPRGPRYDPNQGREQRRSADNGIWMCRLHGAAVDAPDSKYTVELLQQWKVQAQRDAMYATLYGSGPLAPVLRVPSEGELITRVRAAAVADLDVFRQSEKWPLSTIDLMLEVEELNDPVSTSELAKILATLDDLVLVAPPGMGKTTTLFQIAEAMQVEGNVFPIIVPLGDWSVDNTTLLEFIIKRSAFREVSEEELRAVAAKPGMILLLDGWNELDSTTRRRARVEISRLQAEFPEIGMLVSTRQQSLDVPIDGTRISLLPLNEEQQLDITKAIRGDAGLQLLDQAWRTAGVRELITIPLYLTKLLALPEGAPFPTTKEDVLRSFVAAHEEDAVRAEVLLETMHGLHGRFIEGLAVTATDMMNTTLAENVARRSISETAAALVAEGQVVNKPEPNTALEALVSHHMLVRVGNPAGYSFQHQQVQEWYASHYVERLMLASIHDTASRNGLKANILNQPVWEEAILFAVERLAFGDRKDPESCCAAILAAFELDPMLAAEMIYRSDDDVWSVVAPTAQALVKQWHAPGKVDRALRFMINTGRPEFRDQVWPLITHENDQIHLSALRVGRRFRSSVLRSDAAVKIAELPVNIRKNVLHEIAFNSGMDGLDLATSIAINDADAGVKATVIDALAFRRADRHVSDILRSADERTFDLVVGKNLVDVVADEHIRKEVEAARERRKQEGVSAYKRLREIVYIQIDKDCSQEVTEIISEMEINRGQDAELNLLFEARNRYPRAVADGVLERVRKDRTLFYGADDLLSSVGGCREDGDLLKIVLSEVGRHNIRAGAAASVLGPRSVSRILEIFLDAKKQLRDETGNYNRVVSDRYHELRSRVAHIAGGSLVNAARARSAQTGNNELGDLAELIAGHGDAALPERGRPFNESTQSVIRGLAEDWGKRMLASDVSRQHLASIAMLITRAPSVSLLPLLKRLLDENFRRYRSFIEQAQASGWCHGEATNEARITYTHEYQRAFQSINAPETAALMREYLYDEHFGESAAIVLAAQWMAENETTGTELPSFQLDFSKVNEKRIKRACDPTITSNEAEAIFDAVELLISDDSTEEERKRAVALGIIAAQLPHGQRDATIQKLIALAPRRARAVFFQNLVLSGENIDIEHVKNGIQEVLEAAKTQHWILADGYELKEWLRLLPFASPPKEALNIVQNLPEDQRSAQALEEMIAAFQAAPGVEAENVLFELADVDSGLYANHVWRNTVVGRGTLSAGRRFLDLVASGAFTDRRTDHWYTVREISGLIDEYPELRTHLYHLLKGGAATPGFAQLAQAVGENPDIEGILLLVNIEIEHGRSFISLRTIENVVTEKIPSESWMGAYEIVPVPAADLRRRLLAMTTDGGPIDVAARCLGYIDTIWDKHGMPDFEPRHPDIASDKPWPILIPNPDVEVY